MPITGTNTVVTVTAARLAAASENLNRVYVYNSGDGKLFWGGTTVNVNNGIPINPGATQAFELGPQDELYAVSTVTSTAAPGKASVAILHQ